MENETPITAFIQLNSFMYFSLAKQFIKFSLFSEEVAGFGMSPLE